MTVESIWQMTAGDLRVELQGHSGWVTAVSFSSDGKLLASAGYDGAVNIWELSGDTLEATLKGHQGKLQAVAFSSNGPLLASAGDDRVIRLWDSATKELRAELKGAQTEVLCSIAYSPDGRWLATGMEEGVIKLWDVEKGNCVQRWQGHQGKANALAFSSAGQLLASGGADGAICLWNIPAGSLLAKLEGSEGEVKALAFSPDGRWLVSGDEGREVKVWNCLTRSIHTRLAGHDGGTNALAFCQQGGFLVSGGRDGAVNLWAVSKWKLANRIVHGGVVTAVALTDDAQVVVSGGEDGLLALYPMTGERKTLPLLAKGGPRVNAVAFHPNAHVLAVALEHQAALLFAEQGDYSWQQWPPLQTCAPVVRCLAFAAKGGHLALGGVEGNVELWEVSSLLYEDVQKGRWEGSYWSFREGGYVGIRPNGLVQVSAGAEGEIAFLSLGQVIRGYTLAELAAERSDWVKASPRLFVVVGSGPVMEVGPGGLVCEISAQEGGAPVRLMLLAADDEKVERLVVDGRKVAVKQESGLPDGLSTPGALPIKHLVSYETTPGEVKEKRLELEVRDNRGNSTQRTVVLTAQRQQPDKQPPVLWLMEPQIWRPGLPEPVIHALTGNEQRVVVQGFVGDDQEVLVVTVNDQRATLAPVTATDVINAMAGQLLQAEETTIAANAKALSDPTGRELHWKRFRATVLLRPEDEQLILVARDRSGNQNAPLTVQLRRRQNFAPIIVLYKPLKDNYTTSSTALPIEGEVLDDRSVSEVRVNDVSVKEPPERPLVAVPKVDVPFEVGDRFYFRVECKVAESPGVPQYITVTAKDDLGGSVTKQLVVTYELPPSLPASTRSMNLYAVVIGVSKYADQRIPQLRYAAADAQAFADFLKKQMAEVYGQVFVRLLVDEEVTERTIKQALTWLRGARERDVNIIFYAGHGAYDDQGKEAYFLAHDADPDDLYASAFPMQEFQEVVRREYLNANWGLVIADACHAAAMSVAAPRAIRGAEEGFYRSVINVVEAFRQVKPGWCFLAASRQRELSYEYEELGHGAFTYFLMQGLAGEADRQSRTSQDGVVTLGELFDFVYSQVKDYTKDRQHPDMLGDFDNALPVGFIK